ncbi:MAG: DNA polymerase III subunit delta [Gammaproteobacteria bacterium]|nr:DNA polymerase III subunit delta [Gammaproteobacteria bacterium]
MRLYLNQLDAHFKSPLLPVYLMSGDEPLLLEEACQALRQAAHEQGYAEREVYTVETGFDWSRLQQAGQSMSLFAERRLLELRMPGGRPGDTGGKTLVELAENPPEDTVLVVITGKLEPEVQRTKWVKSLDAAGAWLTVYPVSSQEMPGWLRQRMRMHGLEPGEGLLDQLAWNFEGNLLAASQEIEKLALEYQGRIELATIESSLSDNARFDIFRLVDVCLGGDANAVRRMIVGLQSENAAPVLVNWALTREIRQLVAIANGRAGGQSEAELFQQYRVWDKRQALVRQGLKRHSLDSCQQLLCLAGVVDRVIKGRPGRAPWQNGWQALEALALALAGLPLSLVAPKP